jgi:hypothetical protein
VKLWRESNIFAVGNLRIGLNSGFVPTTAQTEVTRSAHAANEGGMKE